MASGCPPPFGDPAEVREGFLCPLCLKDLRAFQQLQAHYEEEHSGEDRAVRAQLRSKGAARRAPGSGSRSAAGAAGSRPRPSGPGPGRAGRGSRRRAPTFPARAGPRSRFVTGSGGWRALAWRVLGCWAFSERTLRCKAGGFPSVRQRPCRARVSVLVGYQLIPPRAGQQLKL